MKQKPWDKTKRQIILRLNGGLGNQLWQLAYALSLKDKFGMEEILLDTSAYIDHSSRQFELDRISLPSYIYELAPGSKPSVPFNVLCRLYRSWRGVMYRLSHTYKDNCFLPIYQRGYVVTHNNAPDNWQLKTNTIRMYGYFENYAAIRHILPILQKTGPLENHPAGDSVKELYTELLSQIRSSAAPAAVSLRLGADLDADGRGTCSKTYFFSAMDHFIEEMKTNRGTSPDFFIFSDNPEQAKRLLESYSRQPGLHITYIPKLTPVAQLYLMRECRCFVLSNSSFSYWGSLLCAGEDKEMIFPDKWLEFQKTDETGFVYGNSIILPS